MVGDDTVNDEELHQIGFKSLLLQISELGQITLTPLKYYQSVLNIHTLLKYDKN